jgi:hypothetical protein
MFTAIALLAGWLTLAFSLSARSNVSIECIQGMVSVSPFLIASRNLQPVNSKHRSHSSPLYSVRVSFWHFSKHVINAKKNIHTRGGQVNKLIPRHLWLSSFTFFILSSSTFLITHWLLAHYSFIIAHSRLSSLLSPLSSFHSQLSIELLKVVPKTIRQRRCFTSFSITVFSIAEVFIEEAFFGEWEREAGLRWFSFTLIVMRVCLSPCCMHNRYKRKVHIDDSF